MAPAAAFLVSVQSLDLSVESWLGLVDADEPRQWLPRVLDEFFAGDELVAVSQECLKRFIVRRLMVVCLLPFCAQNQ